MILVLFGSFDGQTERIARRVGDALADVGHSVEVLSADRSDALAAIDRSHAVIVGGAVHMGRHAPYLERLVAAARAVLEARPNAFFSVSLSAHGEAKQRGDAERCVREFVQRTGWQPQAHAIIAGALPYSRYNPFLRFMMKMIVTMAHGDTDTSRDYEYTDWAQVDAFARGFAKRMAAVAV